MFFYNEWNLLENSANNRAPLKQSLYLYTTPTAVNSYILIAFHKVEFTWFMNLKHYSLLRVFFHEKSLLLLSMLNCHSSVTETPSELWTKLVSGQSLEQELQNFKKQICRKQQLFTKMRTFQK